MKLDKTNLYVEAKDAEKGKYVVCIELPDGSRNYLHSQEMILGECIQVIDDLLGLDIASSANNPYLETDGSYYRLKMTIPPSNLSIDHDLYFHSRKLNLTDATQERHLLLDDIRSKESAEAQD